MRAAKSLATSSARTERETRKTYASLRVMGDALDPEEITKALKVMPTISYRKGAQWTGNDGKERIGRTGLWLLSTDGIVASNSLYDHLAYLLGVLIPDRQDARPLARLHKLLVQREGLQADLACFWHGQAGAARPAIPRYVGEILKLIPAELDLDFANDSADPARLWA